MYKRWLVGGVKIRLSTYNVLNTLNSLHFTGSFVLVGAAQKSASSFRATCSLCRRDIKLGSFFLRFANTGVFYSLVVQYADMERLDIG